MHVCVYVWRHVYVYIVRMVFVRFLYENHATACYLLPTTYCLLPSAYYLLLLLPLLLLLLLMLLLLLLRTTAYYLLPTTTATTTTTYYLCSHFCSRLALAGKMSEPPETPKKLKQASLDAFWSPSLSSPASAASHSSAIVPRDGDPPSHKKVRLLPSYRSEENGRYFYKQLGEIRTKKIREYEESRFSV